MPVNKTGPCLWHLKGSDEMPPHSWSPSWPHWYLPHLTPEVQKCTSIFFFFKFFSMFLFFSSSLKQGLLITGICLIIVGCEIYKQNSFYCTSQVLHFLQIEGLWHPCIKQICWCQFSNSLCSLHVSVSHFENSCNISNFFNILLWSVIPRCYYCKKITSPWRLRWWLPFFRNEVFLTENNSMA